MSGRLPPTLVAGAAVIAAGTIWWHVAGPLVWPDPRVTIYQAAFFGTLGVAVVAALRSRDPAAMRGAAILTVAAVLHTMVHSAATHPLSVHGAINIAVASLFVLTAQERWEALVGLCFVAIVGFGAAAHWDLVPGIAERPRGAFVAWSYPDIAAVLGHAANMLTGSAADGARRSRVDRGVPWLRGSVRPVLAFAHRRRHD